METTKFLRIRCKAQDMMKIKRKIRSASTILIFLFRRKIYLVCGNGLVAVMGPSRQIDESNEDVRNSVRKRIIRNFLEVDVLQLHGAEHFGVKEFHRQLIQQQHWRHQKSSNNNNHNNNNIGRERFAAIRRPNICSYNKKLTFLSKKSKSIKIFLNLCRRQPEIAHAAYLGLAEAAAQCKRQFKFGRWNCTLRPTLKTFGLKANLIHEPSILKKGAFLRKFDFPYIVLTNLMGQQFNFRLNRFRFQFRI
uniref:Protein Wnt n=1 Tax=Romanomermis culicivorax TaxID=13658 RepID=A0A915IMT7_ROMCU